jgi:hypothetical protein
VGETDLSSKARHRRFSAEYKRKILSEAHGCTELGALLRREGLYSSNLGVAAVLLGFGLVPVSLVFILGGVYAASWLVYGRSPLHTSIGRCHCRPRSMACWCGHSCGAHRSR